MPLSQPIGIYGLFESTPNADLSLDQLWHAGALDLAAPTIGTPEYPAPPRMPPPCAAERVLSDKLFFWLFQSRPNRILTLVALSERLDGREILSLDGDVDVYRRFRREPVERIMIR